MIPGGNTMLYAVYRVLYGEDFIQQSIRSILPIANRVFVFWDDRPWGDANGVMYKGNKVTFPRHGSTFDSVLNKVRALDNPKVDLIYDHVSTPKNQFTHLVNDLILPNCIKPRAILFMEPDYVFRSDQLKLMMKGFAESPQVMSTAQVELWKTTEYCTPPRPHRLAAMLWDMRGLRELPPTNSHADPVDGAVRRLNAYVHNLGFCANPKTMLWKHLTAMSFSKAIGDSVPNENWYEDKWLSWDYESNNRNLEISKGHEHTIPYAIPYTDDLPELL